MRPLIQAPEINNKEIFQHTAMTEETVLDLEYKSLFET